MRPLFLAAVLLASCKTQPSPAAPVELRAGVPVKDIVVTEKGFEPSRVEVAASKPVILRFTRKAKETCADEVDIEGDKVRHALPLDVPVEIKLTAPASGKLAFACPMKMYTGAIVVAQ